MARIAIKYLLALLVAAFGCNGSVETSMPTDSGMDTAVADISTRDVSEDAGAMDLGGEVGPLPADSGSDGAPADVAITDSGGGTDSADAGGPDAPLDAGGPDAPLDAGGPDAPLDSGADAASRDAGSDAAPGDGGMDTGPDLGSDSGPDQVALPPEAVVHVAGGGKHTCAARNDGAIYCWGANNARQLGAGVVGDQTQPAPLTSFGDVSHFALGYEFSMAATTAGELYGWGANSTGQLGDGSSTTRWLPVLSTMAQPADLAAPRLGHWHSCAIDASAQAWCWGYNDRGTLGQGTTDMLDHPDPLIVPGLAGVTQIALGDFHTCALLADQTVSCWGYDGFGELGRGSFSSDPRPTPAPVSGLDDAVAIALGHQFSCAIVTGGAVKCWGSNGSGQLGIGSNSVKSTPEPVPGLSGVTAIAAGRKHVCAAKGDGTLWCWGRNSDGQIGDSSTANALSPVMVPGFTDVIAFGLGDNHTCASEAGTLYCWGLNADGQLGTATFDPETAPTPVVWP